MSACPIPKGREKSLPFFYGLANGQILRGPTFGMQGI